ncbi:hypothetical protein CONLIGDRAFT_587216, partial [Coniochaeta ligniaria NRRL 30616]
IPSAVLSSTPDPGLTAFAQLGLYRLDGSRALVSLFDRKSQHIVAEALRATPLNVDEEQLDLLWLCGTAVPRATSICEHVLAGPAASLTIPGNMTGNAPSDLPVSVVLDLDQDERFCDIKDTQKRFYIGVPIRSPAGINIGVYCVFDDKPRQRVSPVEIQFIRDMSRTIMDYLEAKRSHECYRREERMVRGLGSFVEGKATLSNWSQSSNPSSFQDLPGAQEGSLNKKLRGTDRRTLNVFSKASNIIRESIEVAGVVYLDASIRTFGGLIGQEMSSPSVLGRPSSDESSSDEIPSSHTGDAAEGTCCKVLGYSTSQSSSVNGDEAGSPLTTLPERFLHYLLQRYPHGKIYNMEADVIPLSDQAASDLALSFRRRGSETPINPSGATDGQSGKPKARQTIASLLARLFPGARSIAFVPLWDSQRNRWFAGSFVWTRTPTRIFTPENELSYLKVYGLTIMAEVTRLHIKAADKTKMDVLGSISHELRSPLHGVVGAAELLRQTQLDGSQEMILRTIQISSRTLLDTIDHLLDYGKMNGLIKSARLEKSNSTSRLQNQQDPTPAVTGSQGVPVQLDRLAEEVVESVLAGYGYMHMADTTNVMLDPGLSNHRSSWPLAKGDGVANYHGPGQQHNADSEAVQIYLDIEPAASWSFLMHPGAFRRIIMNLFGNSLKFTKAGFIRVSLSQESPSEGPDKQISGFGKIVLNVSDSGKGISEEYLRNQLYTPFAQEDHFAPGTGLGLSLVRQVVTALGGEIHVTSQVGRGTTVRVSMPLPLPSGEGRDEEEASFKAVVQDLAGLRVILRGSGQVTAAKEANLGNDGVEQRPQDKSQLQLIESICQGWLNMHILSEADSQGSTADFIISIKESLSDLEADDTSDLAGCPHIFVYQSSRAVESITDHRRMPTFCEVLSQPLGPRKLAKSLFDSRRRWKEAQRSLSKPASIASLSKERPLLISTPSQAADITAVLKVAGIIDKSSSLTPSVMPLDSKQSATQSAKESAGNGMAAERPESVPADSSSGMVIRSAASRRSVLIVDDNPINRKILAAYMKKIEQPHSTADNGLEALEKYRASPSEYSCILTDISMPVMDGLESSRRVREFERAGQLHPCKIIALTGLSGTDVQQDAFASGVDVFLTRPVTLKSVVDTLEALGVR